MFVLEGCVRLEKLDLVVEEGEVIGAADFFGMSYLSDTSALVGGSDGMLAGLPLKKVRSYLVE